MSILLEALRKSEKKQRPHETPTIHSEVQSGSAGEPLRVLPVSLMVVAVLALTGWFVWNQYRAPAGSYQPPVTLPPEQVQKVHQAASADQGAGVANAKPPAAKGAQQKRTPVESYQPPEQTEPAPANAHTQPSTISQPASAHVEEKSTAAATDMPAAAPRKKQAANQTANAAAKPAGNQQQAAKAGEEFHPGEPEPIGYWELPDAVRASVPVIKFSVLVYATDPADRFVLVNGQRLGEGDSLKPGLEVKEIRRDGVVFSYRLYQFLVER